MSGHPERNRILVTGASGQLGSELIRSLASLGEIVAPTRAEMNLTSAASIRDMVGRVRPRWIVNAAAYTSVDRAESEPELAFAINTESVRLLGIEAQTLGAPVIHFSTDYVFDGSSAQPYVENDATGPRNLYGASKLAGERALLQVNPASLIFRTSWVYGATGRNFLRTILALARERDLLRIVDDQHGAPTWSRDLARMTAQVIARIEAQVAGGSLELAETVLADGGIYHAAASGETTWAGFARQALEIVGKSEPGTKLAAVIGIASSEYPAAAVRPKNSRLNSQKLAEVFGWRMMDWKDSLAQVMDALHL